VRVLISIEPRSYREAIGEALRGLRPHVELAVVEPEELWREVVSFRPTLVIADRPDTLPTADRRNWVEFRPYQEPPARIFLGGRLRELMNVDLQALLSVVDEAEELSQRSADAPNR
jgi:hypothetical protein